MHNIDSSGCIPLDISLLITNSTKVIDVIKSKCNKSMYVPLALVLKRFAVETERNN